MQFGVALLVCAVLVAVTEGRKFGFGRFFDFGQFQRRGTDMTSSVTSTMTPRPLTEVVEGSGSGMEYTEEDWPYAIMEFSILVGRCDKKNKEMRSMSNKPAYGILRYVCPHVLKVAKYLVEADEPARERAEESVEEAFHLLQCVNLQAERETMKMMKDVSGYSTRSIYLQEAEPLFEICERAFDDTKEYLDKWSTEFTLELTSDKGSVDYLLRKALADAILHR